MNIELYKILFEKYAYIKVCDKKIERLKKLKMKFNLVKHTKGLLQDETDYKHYTIMYENNVVKIGTKYLKICCNQILEKNVISNTVTHLIFSIDFNQIITENVLPDSITHIKFSYNFNQPLKKGILPHGIKEVIFGQCFNCELEKGSLPDTITHLTIRSGYMHNLTKNILPLNLKYLIISHNFRGEIELRDDSKPYHLIFDNLDEQDFEDDTIYFSKNYRNYHKMNDSFSNPLFVNSDNKLIIKIPLNITHITFGYNFNKYIDKNVIPHSVKYIDFSSKYIINIENNTIPHSVEHLYLRGSFNQEIKENMIPNNVKYLTFGNKFDHKLNFKLLPNNIIYLKIDNYSHELLDINLIKSLCNIVVNSSHNEYIFDNKYLVGIMDHNEISYNINNEILHLDFNDIDEINSNISTHIIGNIILKELVSKVFNPQRLLKLCKIYNIEFDKLMDIY